MPTIPRPAFAPSDAHYVGGADGGVWVTLDHQSGANYTITFFGRKGPSKHMFKMAGLDVSSAPISVESLKGWDGVVMHLGDAKRRLVLIK